MLRLEFSDTPEINIGASSKIEIFHDPTVTAEDLFARSVSRIEDLRDGSRDEIVLEIQKMIKRFQGRDGEEECLSIRRCRRPNW